MRQYCPQCCYPLKTCVCEAVQVVHSPVQFLIIQHEKEATHAKNTVKLLNLALTQLVTVVHNNPHAESLLVAHLTRAKSPAIIYPTQTSTGFEKAANDKLHHDLYVVLDGSWRQAFGLWQRFTQLHSLPQYHFANAPESDYRIRHTKMTDSLSTLEAVAYTLETLSGTDVEPLRYLQAHMQEMWQAPAAHRRHQ